MPKPFIHAWLRALVAGAVDQRSDHVLEDGPVRDARIVAAKRVRVDVFGRQSHEPVPQGSEQA
ncbi:hypothetical protein GCM10018953_75600 [Streptosporangium nondiastaticum]